VTALCNQLEAFVLELGDDHLRYFYQRRLVKGCDIQRFQLGFYYYYFYYFYFIIIIFFSWAFVLARLWSLCTVLTFMTCNRDRRVTTFVEEVAVI